MGMIFTTDTLEGMCDLMCDNNIHSKNIQKEREDMNNYRTVGELTESLISLRDRYKSQMTRSESDLLADVCNVLDRTLSNDSIVEDILYGE